MQIDLVGSQKNRCFDSREVTEATIFASLIRTVHGALKQYCGSRLPVKVNVRWVLLNYI